MEQGRKIQSKRKPFQPGVFAGLRWQLALADTSWRLLDHEIMV
jgi:hypothetical protein